MALRMQQLGSYWTDFNEIWHLKVFRKSDKKNGTLHEYRQYVKKKGKVHPCTGTEALYRP
jgi:hypothetical protein